MIFKVNNSCPTICLLHGYGSNKEYLLKWFKDSFGSVLNPIIAIDSRGSNKKNGNCLSLQETQSDWLRIINRRKKKCILIGSSIGGFNALCLTPNKYVIKTITISSPTSNTVFKDMGVILGFYYEYIRKIFDTRKRITKEDLEIFEQLSLNLEDDRKIIGKKVSMIHGIDDLIVPYSHFLYGKKLFHLRDGQCLAIKGHATHIQTIFDEKVIKFIKRKLSPFLCYQ
jgi:hypothetical protein